MIGHGVIESVLLRSPDKGFWACLGDLPPDMPRRPETWVSLCNLTLKLCGISHSSGIATNVMIIVTDRIKTLLFEHSVASPDQS